MKKIHMTSAPFIVMNILFCLVSSSILYLFKYVDDFNLFLFIFCIFLNLFSYFTLFLSLTHRVLIYEDKFIFFNLKRKEVYFMDIDKIYVEEMELDNTIYIKLKSGDLFKFSGKMTLLGHKKNKKYTISVVEKMNKFIGFK